MLEEAKETERLNIASLKKYEQYELERKKKREKNSLVRSVKPPLIKMVDTASGRFLTLPSVKEFKMPETKVSSSGLPINIFILLLIQIRISAYSFFRSVFYAP